jgi:hypothetical protein
MDIRFIPITDGVTPIIMVIMIRSITIRIITITTNILRSARSIAVHHPVSEISPGVAREDQEISAEHLLPEEMTTGTIPAGSSGPERIPGTE